MKTILLLVFILLPGLFFAQNSATRLVVQRGHTSPTKKLIRMAGERYIATADKNSIVLWDIKQRRQYCNIVPGKGLKISNMSSTNSEKIIAYSEGNSVVFFDIAREEIIKKFVYNNEIKAIAINPVSGVVAALSSGTMYIRGYPSGNTIKEFSANTYFSFSGINVLKYSRDGEHLVCGSGTSVVVYKNDGSMFINADYKYEVQDIDFSTDNKHWAVLTSETFGIGEAFFYEFGTKSVKSILTGGASTGIVYGPGNEVMICNTRQGRVFDGNTLNEKFSFKIQDWTGPAGITADGKYYIIARLVNSNTNKASVVDFYNLAGKVVFSLKPLTSFVLSSASNPVTPEVLTADWNGNIRIFDLSKGKLVKSRSGSGAILTIPGRFTYSPDGKLLAVGKSFQDDFEIWQTNGWQELYTYRLENDISGTSISFMPGEKAVIVGGGYASYHNLMARFNIETNVKEWEFSPYKKEVNQVSIHPLGKVFASVSIYGELDVWKTEDHSSVKRIIKPAEYESWNSSLISCNFSYDGKYLSYSGGYDLGLKVFSGDKYKLIKELETNYTISCHCFDFQNQYLAIAKTSDTLNSVQIYKISDWSPVASLNGHSAQINWMNFTNDGQKLFTASNDGTAKLWDWKNQKEIASFIGIGNDDYIIVTPDNYYMGSKGAYQGVAFKWDEKLFPFDQFDLRFNRPDIVLQKIGYAGNELINSLHLAYLKRLKKNGFTEEQLTGDFHIPEIKILTREMPVSTTNKKFNFTVEAMDSKFLLDRLLVYVNDIPLWGMKGFDLKNLSVSKFTKEIYVDLSQGDNKIQVSVMNEKGAESFRESFNLSYETEITKPDLYLLCIGVSHFQQSEYNLNYASKDARDIVAFFNYNPEVYNQINKITLLDNEAITSNILAARSRLLNSKEDDVVIVFIASHGLLDEKLNYFMATPNIDFLNPAVNGLSYDNFENLFDGIPARHKLILIDACHSGEVDKDEQLQTPTLAMVQKDEVQNGVKSRGFKSTVNRLGLSNSFELMQEMFADLRKGTGAVVISSASGKEYAFESSDWQNGLFTYAFLEGLKTKNADLNKDNKIMVSEIRDYVTKKVQNMSNGKQNPTSRSENLEFDFRVW